MEKSPTEISVPPPRPTKTIRLAKSGDTAALDIIQDLVFGPGRFARTSFRIREQGGFDPRLSFVAETEGQLTGAVHFTPVATPSQSAALLLGPLVVHPQFTKRQIGSALVRHGLDAARNLGYRIVLLVGDLCYFQRLGFAVVPRHQLILPGPVTPERFLFHELQKNALQDFNGPLHAVAALSQ